MKISQQRINDYLNRIHGSICPLCNSNRWTISDQVFQAPEFDYNGIIVGGISYPMVPLTCQTCGNTYFINALFAGLIDKEVTAPQNNSEYSTERNSNT